MARTYLPKKPGLVAEGLKPLSPRRKVAKGLFSVQNGCKRAKKFAVISVPISSLI